MKNKFFITALFLSALFCSAQNTNNKYSESVRENASTFHKNFSTGEFEKNGPLVDEKIYVNSNNSIVIGRDNFVERIKRFHTPFPTLKLRDKIIIVDENQVGLLYAMEGTQDGPFGTIPASGNKINVYAAEFFTMNEDAKMKELLTITQLDQLKNQILGNEKIVDFEQISLLPIKTTDLKYKKELKHKLDLYVQNFNSRDWVAMEKMFSPDADILINGKKVKNSKQLVDNLNKMISVIPNITFHQTRNIVEGDRGAVAYEINGSYNVMENGKSVEVNLRDIKQGAHFQFNSKGFITNAIIVYNSEDLAKYLDLKYVN